MAKQWAYSPDDSVLEDVVAQAREVVASMPGQGLRDALRHLSHSAILLFKARGGFAAVKANPSALKRDRLIMRMLGAPVPWAESIIPPVESLWPDPPACVVEEQTG